jgi:mRNA-degrading endonuclease toxin of MazEF toxin-antitoxin module
VSTSGAPAKRGPTAVPLAEGIAGLPRSSAALCHQVTTLDRAKLTRRLGRLPEEALREIDEGLKAALDLE